MLEAAGDPCGPPFSAEKGSPAEAGLRGWWTRVGREQVHDQIVPFPGLRTNVMFCADERLLRGVFIRQHRLIPRHDWWSWLSSGRSTLAKIPDDQGRVILDRCGVYYVEPIEGV